MADEPRAGSIEQEVTQGELGRVNGGKGEAFARREPMVLGLTVLDLVVLLTVMLVSALYVGSLLRVGWIPNDEGTLAQSALRVMQGQLPHRDFAESYTGGLTFLHAGAFRLFGVNLFSMRVMAYLFFLAWLPAVYYVARRFVRPITAGLVTLTAVGWNYPNYVAAMPSWYNLFFATFGAAALLRYLEAGRRRWLVLAGICGGASLLVKVIGFYYVAAVLFFLLFVEQSRQGAGRTGKSCRKNCRTYRAVCGSLLMLYLVLLLMVIWPQLRDGEVYHFLLPSAGCVGLLLWREKAPSSMTSGERFAGFFRLAGPFLLGIGVVIGLCGIPAAASGSTSLLVRGVISSTSSRMLGLGGRQHAPGMEFVLYGLVPLALIVLAMYGGWARRWMVTLRAGAVAGLTAVLGMAYLSDRLEDTWLMAGMLTPLVVLLGVSLIVVKPREGGWRREKALGGGQLASHIWPKPGQIWSTNAFMRMVAGKGSRWRAACFPQLANDGPDMGHQCFGVDGGGKSSSAAGGEAGQAAGSLLPASGEATADRVLGEQRLMLMISLAACCSLVQYPFPYVTYFCYTAPLTLLAVVAAVAMRREAQGNTLRDTPGRTQGKFLLAALLLFYLGYGFVGMVPKHVYNPDLHRRGELRALRLPRAGGLKIDVTSSHVDGTTTLYEELIPFLQEHAANGLMYAGNDCPELYFLSGLKNPTSNDTGAPESEVLMALRSGELRLVVINDKTFFASGSTSAELREEIAQRLPNVAKRGRFSIYWR